MRGRIRKPDISYTDQLRVLRSRGEFKILDGNGEVIHQISEDGLIPAAGGSPSAQASGEKALASQSKQVLAGQSIHTEAGASVDLYSTTGAVVQVQEEAELYIPRAKEDATESSLELLKGSLFLNVDGGQLRKERKEFRLKTPTAILTVKGTQFFANVKPGETISGVYEGEVAGRIDSDQTGQITPGLVTQFYENKIETRKMSENEREDRRVFDSLTVTRSSLAEQKWGWTAFDWEVHSLLRKEGPAGKVEISNLNIKRGRNQAGNLAVQFRAVDDVYKYGEYRIDTVVPESGDKLLGAEFRIRANRDVPLIITTIGADQKELDKKKGGLLDRTGFEYLVQFHNLTTIQDHKNQYWENYRLDEDQVDAVKDQWTTHFVPFSRSDYPEDYEVKSWFIFLCFGEEVVAEHETLELEIAPPVMIFEKKIAP